MIILSVNHSIFILSNRVNIVKVNKGLTGSLYHGSSKPVQVTIYNQRPFYCYDVLKLFYLKAKGLNTNSLKKKRTTTKIFK